MFVFGDLNIHHKDWLTYSGGTDRPGELCFNFSVSNDLTQIVNFPTRIPDCDSHSPALFDLFLLTVVFVLQWLSLLWQILLMLLSQFPLTIFHYDYSRADWDGLHDHLRNVPWGDIFKFCASAAASEFCEWIQVGIDVYIPHRKCQVKPHSSPLFSAAFAAAIVHRNQFFVSTNRINLLNLK